MKPAQPRTVILAPHPETWRTRVLRAAVLLFLASLIGCSVWSLASMLREIASLERSKSLLASEYSECQEMSILMASSLNGRPTPYEEAQSLYRATVVSRQGRK